METAENNDSIYILANDPDADRLAIAERVQDKWKIFNGNEIGTLLGTIHIPCNRVFGLFLAHLFTKGMTDCYHTLGIFSSDMGAFNAL